MPEVQGQQQVELALGRLVVPRRPRCGRWLSAAPRSARSELSVPSRCLRKYSLPLADEPSRLARQIGEHPREVLRGVGVLAGEPQVAGLELVDDVLGRPARPAAAASSARSSGLRSNVGYDGIQPIRARLGDHVGGAHARRAARCRSAARRCRRRTCRSGTGRCAGTSTRCWIICRGGRCQSRPKASCAQPVTGRHFSWPDVVRPAAAVDALAAGERGQRRGTRGRSCRSGTSGWCPRPSGSSSGRSDSSAFCANSRAIRAAARAGTPVIGLLPGRRVRRGRVVVRRRPVAAAARRGPRRTGPASGRRPW